MRERILGYTVRYYTPCLFLLIAASITKATPQKRTCSKQPIRLWTVPTYLLNLYPLIRPLCIIPWAKRFSFGLIDSSSPTNDTCIVWEWLFRQKGRQNRIRTFKRWVESKWIELRQGEPRERIQYIPSPGLIVQSWMWDRIPNDSLCNDFHGLNLEWKWILKGKKITVGT